MRTEPVLGIQPAVMRWARQTIGLSVHDVAAKLKRPVEEVEAWESESGAGAPSYAQLEKLAYQIYKRPLAVFFLPNPPEEISPEREFRTLPNADLQSLAGDTHMQIRRAHAFQIALKELFDDRNPSEQLIWQQLRLSRDASIAQQALSIRQNLGISLESQIGWKSDDFALKQWRQAIENRGVFIFKAPFKQKDISGFCLLDQAFPLIYINNSTSKTRQTFSLMHELAHLLLSMNGLSKFDNRYIDQLPQAERQIEQFCNAVAAEVLIPLSDFEQQTRTFQIDIERVGEEQFSNLANRYGVSREAILRRFLDQGRVTAAFYTHQSKLWAGQQKPGSGGDWYASQNSYLSDRFAKEVVRRHYRNQLSIEQAADLLGIKAKNFAGLEQRILQGAAA
jgi:Zn-dependent peptidase ImmA (M78 family)